MTKKWLSASETMNELQLEANELEDLIQQKHLDFYLENEEVKFSAESVAKWKEKKMSMVTRKIKPRSRELLSVEETLTELQIEREELEDMIRRKEIAFLLREQSLYFPKDSVEFIQAQKMQSPTIRMPMD